MARPRGRALERKRAEEARSRAAQQRSSARRRNVLIAVAAVAVVAAGVLVVVAQPPAPGLAVPDLGNQHLAAVDQAHIPYNSRPPTSGPHLPTLAPWGESDVELPPELFVHNLEDGGVVLAYSCDSGCPELLEGLRSTLRRFEGRRLILTPYRDIVDPDGLPHAGAAVAWNRVLYFDDLDEESLAQLEDFIRVFEGVDHHV